MDDQVESYRVFAFSDEADELQTPIFDLESLDQLETSADGAEETKEWGQNGVLHNSSVRIREIRSLVVDEIGDVSSGVISPPHSLTCIPSSTRGPNGRNGDDKTMNSSVSSAQLGSTMNTPSGYTSASASNASSLQPALYSAIGSLEKCSANSFGQVRIQHKAMSGRDFDRPVTIQQALIPPAPSNLAKGQGLVAFKSTLVNENRKGRNIVNKVTKVSSESEEKKSKIDKLGTSTKTKRRNHNAEGDITELKTERAGLKKVTIKDSMGQIKTRKPVEMFRPSCDAYTPRMEKKKIKYKPAEMRTTVQKMSSTMGTLARPNFRDALRRVAMILQQHITKIERRFEHAGAHFLGDNLFQASMREVFSEGKYSTPRYKCTIVRIPMARPGMVYGLREVRPIYSIPSEREIYDFGHQLFKSVQLSSECSIVCLIYVERLMEVAKVPLLASTWRPVFLVCLLLASKVWQDLSSWNIEFASVYPQFSLDAINKLELEFLRMVKWDLYISSSLYAKYYFALRSLLEKPDFRMRYNRMVGGVGSVDVSEALKIQQRSELVKEEALLQLSRSM